MTTINKIKTSKLVDGPVRKIGVQSRSITGTMPNGNRYESSLERDFMMLLEFDHLVDLYTPQPITIKYQMSNGQHRQYTPDGLIEYRSDIHVHDCRPVLVEVKYREDFIGNAYEWLPKFRAARQYAKAQGWLFEIVTEDRIRTPFFKNLQFLIQYKNTFNAEVELWILDVLKEKQTTSPLSLINSMYKDKWNQATLTPFLWSLIARREIGCDLSEPITMQSEIWSL